MRTAIDIALLIALLSIIFVIFEARNPVIETVFTNPEPIPPGERLLLESPVAYVVFMGHCVAVSKEALDHFNLKIGDEVDWDTIAKIRSFERTLFDVTYDGLSI